MIIQPGYLGSATIGGVQVRCTDFSVNVNQTPLFYDHYIGLRDSVPADIYDVKKDDGERNKQKIIWRASTKTVQGGMSFPWTDLYLGQFWPEARTGDSFDMDFNYTCGLGRLFTGCKINSYTLRISAGDLVTSTVDIVGKHMGEKNDDKAPLVTTTAKLVTWDSVNVSVSGGGIVANPKLAYFECNIANNCMPIFTMGGNISSSSGTVTYLEPYEIRVGMQVVTGTLAYYDEKSIKWMEDISTASSITLTISDWSQKFNVIFHPQQQNAATGPIIRTIQFTGTDDALPE